MSQSAEQRPPLQPPKPPEGEYQAPDISWEEPFEPLAYTFSCAKQPDTSAQCNASPSG